MKRRTLFKSLALILILSVTHSVAKTPKESNMDIQLIITFNIKKDKLPSFMKIMKAVKKDLPQVEGCKEVEVFQRDQDKYTITLIETWESIEKHKTHIKHVIDSGDWNYISSHLTSEPKSHYYQKI